MKKISDFFKKETWETFWSVCSKREQKLIIFSVLGVVVGGFFFFLGYYYSHTKLVPARGGVLREGVVGEVSSLNPILADFNDANRALIELVYKGLLEPDGNGGFKPALAKSYQKLNNGSVWRVVLRDDIYWQDGKKITTNDIVFTVEKILDPRIHSPLANVWDGVVLKAYDQRIIEFYLKEPYQFFERNLADLKIIPKHIWENVPVNNYWISNFNLIPVGDGPFVVKSYQKTNEGLIKSYTLVANKHYFKGEPYIQKIEFKFYNNYQEASEALRSGKIDSLADVVLLNEENRFLGKKVVKIKIPRFYAVFFNNQGVDLFKDDKVRLALLYATDKKKIISQVIGSQGEVVNTPFVKDMEGWNPEFEKNYFDLDKAKELLKDDGFELDHDEGVLEKKGEDNKKIKLEFSLLFPESPLLFRTANLLKKMWGQVGAKVELESKPMKDLEDENIFPRDFEALMVGQIYNFSPDLYSFWHSSQKFDPGLNIALFDDEETDQLLEDIRTNPDKKKREKDYFDFQKIFLEKNPAIFLFSPDYLWLVPSSLRGIDYLKKIDYPFERFVGVEKWYLKEIRE